MSTPAVAAFLAQLRQAGILDDQQLEEAQRLGEKAARPGEVAGELVKRGWITPHQANQVARGRGAELVLGSYVILEPLGSGGMGEVVKARHQHLDRQVALKFIQTNPGDPSDTVLRFRREVRLLADLRHPHIVQAYDAGNVGTTWFLAMELLEGIDLDRLVRERGPLPIGQACDYVRQAALGLQHAHERGLVHRDVKPSNLFLTSEGIKLLDLGLARTQAAGDATQPGDLTRANTVMGTPDYLAPEQALDPRRADARSDLYSLGCTLYFLLTGRPPFPEGTLAQKLLAHQTALPPALETLRPDVPPALADLVRRMVAKSPAQRPASAAVVAKELLPLATTTVADGHAGGSGGAAAPAGPSLINAGGEGPERGWTLAPETMPPTPAASLVRAGTGAPERGFTLAPDSLPPTATAAPERKTATVKPRAGKATLAATETPLSIVDRVTSALSPLHLRLVLAGGVAVACLFLLVGVVLIAGAMSRPQTSAAEKPVAVKPAGPPPSWLFPNGPRRFLSELQELDVRSGEWPFTKGKLGNPEGNPIKVGGKLSPHGLGMHPPVNPAYAGVKYRLGKEAELFKATVAIDDSTNWCWSPATFTVLGDGKELWKSAEIWHKLPRSQDCQVIVKDVEMLELRVQVPNLNKGVHTVWVEPRVLQKFDSPDGPGGGEDKRPAAAPGDKTSSLTPTGPKETDDLYLLPTIAPDRGLAEQKAGDKVFLSDLKEFAFKTTPTNWPFAKQGRVGDPRNPAAEIRVNGDSYPHGLGMHPPNTDFIRVCYALGKRGSILRGSVALDDGDDPPWSIKTTFFVVIGDGKVLWRSQGIKDRGVVEPFKVDVRGVAVLELRVYTDYAGANGSRAVWLDPYVTVAEE
jgi:hypothetical protein